MVLRRMKISIVIRSLGQGGAEYQAALTAVELGRRGHDVEVVTFHEESHFADLVIDGAVQLRSLDVPTARVPTALVEALRQWHPDVVYSYLAGPNLLTLAARPFVGHPPVVWGIRSTGLRLEDETRLGSAVYRLEPRCSRTVDLVISNSSSGRDAAVRRGFRPRRFVVVPNGIEIPDVAPAGVEDRLRVRAALGLNPAGLVIGRIGRVHPMEDLPTLLRAVARLPEHDPPVTLVVVGNDESDYAAALRRRWGDRAGWAELRWVGARSDVGDILAAFDITVSSSAYGEAFPNAVAESMAHAVPVIGTDVGDTAILIGDPDMVVPPETPGALADLLHRLLSASEADRRRIGSLQRDAVLGCSVEAMGASTERLLSDLVHERRR